MTDFIQTIDAIVLDFCTAYLSTKPTRTDSETEMGLVASISFQGDRHAQVIFQCTRVFAEHAAREMFSEAQVDETQVRDATAEIVNIVAGNLKAPLQMKTMSLPTVVVAEKAVVHVRAMKQLGRHAFTTPAGSFSIGLFVQE